MVYIPGQTLATINDLVPGVRKALQNRAEVTPDVAAPWIMKSLKEITRIVPFMELQTTGPLQSLTVNQFAYPVAFFLNTGDDYGEHSSLSIFVDFPTNTIAYPLNYQTPRAIEPLLHIPGGLPSKWTRYGTQIFVGPQPNQAYNIFMRYQRKHPFNPNLPTSPVMIDETWFDIIEYAAAERGAIELRWNDQAKFLHDILFGDPEFQSSDGKKGRPGLIFARKLQMEQDEGQNVRQVQVTVARYS